jgi:hypothetical protein
MEHKDYLFLLSQEPTSDPYSETFLVLNFQVPMPLLILAKKLKLKKGAVLKNLCMAFRVPPPPQKKKKSITSCQLFST